MQYDEFIGQIQRRLGMTDTAEAISAMRATLETLGERLSPAERGHLAAQLPPEVAVYLDSPDSAERFGLGEFFERVSRREGADEADAAVHARVVMEIVEAAITEGEMKDIRAELPDEFERLFAASSLSSQ